MLNEILDQWPGKVDAMACVVIQQDAAPQFGQIGFGHLYRMSQGEDGELKMLDRSTQVLPEAGQLSEAGWLIPGQMIWISYHRTGPIAWLSELDLLIGQRERERPEGSYTTHLFERGTGYIAQKVGEEATETAIAAVSQSKEDLLDEASDLLFHLLVLLQERGLSLGVLSRHLAARHR